MSRKKLQTSAGGAPPSGLCTDRAKRYEQRLRNSWIVGIAILLGTVAIGLANVTDAGSKLKDLFEWLVAPSGPSVKISYIHSDQDGLHFWIRNDGKAAAFLTDAEFEVLGFEVTRSILDESAKDFDDNDPRGHQIRSGPAGGRFPPVTAHLDRRGASSEIAALSKGREYLFGVRNGPLSMLDAVIVSHGGSCRFAIKWKGEQTAEQKFEQTLPCSKFPSALRELTRD